MCVFLTVHKHIIQYIYISKSELRFNKRTNEKTFSINLNTTHQSLRTCLVTVFIFYFRFLVFKGKRKKKTNFFCFQNEKHVWLVVLRNTFFKNKIQEICLVVVFEKVEFCFLWLIFFFLNYIYPISFLHSIILLFMILQRYICNQFMNFGIYVSKGKILEARMNMFVTECSLLFCPRKVIHHA